MLKNFKSIQIAFGENKSIATLVYGLLWLKIQVAL